MLKSHDLSIENQFEEEEYKSLLKNSIDSEDSFGPARQSSYNETTKESLEELDRVRSLPFFRRNCRKIGRGSLRGSVITWIRVTMGIGVFALSFYVKKTGALLGLFMIVLAAFINYNTFIFIFEASQFTNINTYPDVVKKLLGKNVSKFFKFTMLFEFLSVVLLYCLASWNLFQFFAYKTGFFKEEWIIDKNTLSFDQYNINVLMYRLGFFFFLFIISFRNLLKETLESTRIISLIFISVLFFLVFYILIQAPIFINHFKEIGKLEVTYLWKEPSFDWFDSFYAILLTFNIHVMALDIKKELRFPILKRLKKTCGTAMIIQAILGGLLGFVGYISLGDQFTPSLVFLRKPINIDSLMETIMSLLLFAFLICLIIGLSTLNVPLRRFIIQASGVKIMTKKKYFFFSIVPFLLILLIGILIPYITNILTIFGLTVYNVNAYLIPILLKYRICIIRKETFQKKILFLSFFLIMLIGAIIGTFINILKIF